MESARSVVVLATFCDVAERERAARELAAHLGAEAALIFVRDPELDVLLPARGLPQTLRGAGWRVFLKACNNPGRHEAVLPHPERDGTWPVTGSTAFDGTTLVLLGGQPDEKLTAEVMLALPLLGAALRAEARVTVAEGNAAAALQAGRLAQDLAIALDTARSDLERTLGNAAHLNRQLQELDRRKDEFIAMLGHELRNPMAAISSALEVMRRRGHEVDVSERTRVILERQAQQLSRLIDDLLDVARITRGRIELRLERVEIGDILRRAVDTTQPLIVSKQHRLSVRHTEPIWISADAMRLEQILTNLLTNAAKYTDYRGDIDVSVTQDDQLAKIAVKDSGIGIASDALPRVFEPFVQISPAIDRSQGGMGIGLTLVKKLALLHGGSIDVTSEVGSGSVFTLSLPVLDQAAVSSSAVPTAVLAPKGRRVLIVDDNTDSAEMVAALIEGWGHHTRQENDGPAALEAFLEFHPDVVLLDIGLPGIDGYEVARRLRAMSEVNGYYLVAVSGYGLPSDKDRSKAAGFDAHLVKPVSTEQLQRVLATPHAATLA